MRLIDADALLEIVEERYLSACAQAAPGTRRNGKSIHYGIAIGMNFVRNVINEQPTIEAEPVVRCRDCRKRRSRGCPMCDYEQLWDDDEGWVDAYRDRTENEGYCHMGAKMDGGNENG